MVGKRIHITPTRAALTVTVFVALMAGPTAAGASSDPRVKDQAAASFTAPPPTGDISEPISVLPSALAQYGYVEQEFFASGTATAFTATSMPSDGRWSIEPDDRRPYRTRIIVRRPADPAPSSTARWWWNG